MHVLLRLARSIFQIHHLLFSQIDFVTSIYSSEDKSSSGRHSCPTDQQHRNRRIWHGQLRHARSEGTPRYENTCIVRLFLFTCTWALLSRRYTFPFPSDWTDKQGQQKIWLASFCDDPRRQGTKKRYIYHEIYHDSLRFICHDQHLHPTYAISEDSSNKLTRHPVICNTHSFPVISHPNSSHPGPICSLSFLHSFLTWQAYLHRQLNNTSSIEIITFHIFPILPLTNRHPPSIDVEAQVCRVVGLSMILSHAHDPEESRAYNFCVHSARTGGFGSLAPWCLLLGIGMNFFFD